jgi:hypothetical protein
LIRRGLRAGLALQEIDADYGSMGISSAPHAYLLSCPRFISIHGRFATRSCGYGVIRGQRIPFPTGCRGRLPMSI